MAGEPWYRELFDEVYLRSYGPMFAAMDPEREVEFLARRLGLEPGMRVLDLCCGQGRHAVPLARRGLRVVGLDQSETLLGRAAGSARAAGVELELVRRDMREIDRVEEFDAVVNLFTAFGYLGDDREDFRVLEGVERALKPGGRFAIDLINYLWLARHWEPTGWRRSEDGLLTLEERRADWMEGTHTGEFTFIEPDGRRRTIAHRIRLFPPHELCEWLRRAGLRPEELFGDLRGAPYGLDSPRLVAVARKD